MNHLLARIRRISPETAGVIASLATLSLLAAVSSVYAAVETARRAEIAKATASQETPAARAQNVQPPPTAPQPEAPEAAVPPPRPPAAQQGEAFIDLFKEPELHERWMASDGWSNGDWTSNDWRESQIRFTEHGLRIALEKAPPGSEKPLMGGEIRTNEYLRYGYFEMRMRMPRGAGIVMGFFTYAGQDGKTRPHEIDIEFLGQDTRMIELALHEGGGATGKKIQLPFDAADGFHTYGFEWRPDSVRWYADGKLIHTEAKGRAPRISRPQQLMISLWASEQLHEWVGKVDFEKAPWHLDVACAAYSPVYEGRQLCAN